MNYYFLLATLFAIFQKIYDDFYDNNLYEKFFINKDTEPYFNEFFKNSNAILLTILSLYSIVFFLWFTLINLVTLSFNKKDYGPYEFSALLATSILLFFINWKDLCVNETLYQFLGFLLFSSTFAYIFEKVIGVYNIEFSYKKLISRLITLFVASSFLLLNYLFDFIKLNKGINMCLYYIIGYMLTSCTFQIILLYNLYPNQNKK